MDSISLVYFRLWNSSGNTIFNFEKPKVAFWAYHNHFFSFKLKVSQIVNRISSIKTFNLFYLSFIFEILLVLKGLGIRRIDQSVFDYCADKAIITNWSSRY